MSLTGVIELTGFSEDCSKAIASLIPVKDYFKNIIIIHGSYVDDETSMYDEWKQHKQALHPVQVSFVSHLDAEQVQGQAVVELNPFCAIRRAALDNILVGLKGANQFQTHMGVSSSLVLKDFSIWYGFIVISYVIDWFWQRVWNRDKMYQYQDVRVRRIVQVGGQKYLPDNSWIWFIRNAGCLPRLYGGQSVVTTPTLRGWHFVVWYYYNHRHYRWSWWLIPFSLLYAIVSMAAYALLLGNITSIYVLFMYMMEIVVSYLICRNYIKLELGLLFCLMFPVFWILFPFVVIYSKIVTPQRAWIS